MQCIRFLRVMAVPTGPVPVGFAARRIYIRLLNKSRCVSNGLTANVAGLHLTSSDGVGSRPFRGEAITVVV